LGIAYSEFSDADREAIVAAYPRTEGFKEDIIRAFYDGIKHKPETTFGNVKADVLSGQGSDLQAGQFLQRDPRLRLARLNLSAFSKRTFKRRGCRKHRPDRPGRRRRAKRGTTQGADRVHNEAIYQCHQIGRA